MLHDAREWKQGRIGEILQFFIYKDFAVEMQDLADRTEKRAPLLYGKCQIPSPDISAIKTARFFVELKTKTKHQLWGGGAIDDPIKYAARTEEGIDRDKWHHYQQASQRWRQPVVLSVLCIKAGDMIAATLDQLGKPRCSPRPEYDLVNWDIRQFSSLASFDADRLQRLFNFNNPEPRIKILQDLWLQQMPREQQVRSVLSWLSARQLQFDVVRQFIFDQIEREWK